VSHPIRSAHLLTTGLALLVSVAQLSQAASVAPTVGAVIRDCPQCPEMVVVPEGRFVMGSTPAESAAAKVREDTAAREWPAHSVRIPKPFAIGRYEVTRGEYGAFVAATRRADGGDCITWDQADGRWQPVAKASWREPGFPQRENHPAVCLDLADSSAYAAWLSSISGQRYRLPTEAEWEHAARAGTTTMNTWGDGYEQICVHANSSDLTRAQAHGGIGEEPTRFFTCRDGVVYTSPVGSFPANPFGLHDMVGNIWEWVQDCYTETYEGAPMDGSVWMWADCERRVVRGGAWYSRTWFLRPAARSRELPTFRSATLGLRVVRELP
jgi:formylglycine-generating enzyme